jgi:iron complex outermembrane receptor protein
MKHVSKVSFSIGLLFIVISTFAQNTPIINATVSGTVLDAITNERLIGASVSIKGTTNGASTDANGEFRLITGQKLPFTLVVSYLGYKTRELVVNEPKVEVRLEAGSNQLEDVVAKKSPKIFPFPSPSFVVFPLRMQGLSTSIV